MFANILYAIFIYSPYFFLLLVAMIMLQRIMPSFIQMWVVKTLAAVLFLTYSLGFLHYTLPQRDVVRILDAYEKRMDVSSNSLFWGNQDAGTLANDTRDVRFIDAEMPDGSVMVYRNEDTGFGWPPYFKFDSSDISAQAKQLISTKEEPQWVAIRHYGWRNRLFSLFPNATSMKPVSGPDVKLIPWFNIIFFIFFGLVCLGIYRLLQRFKRRRVDPMIENAEDAWDDMNETATGFGDKARNWFKRTGGAEPPDDIT